MAQRGRVPNPEPHSRARQPKSPGHPPSRARAHTHKDARARAPLCPPPAVSTVLSPPSDRYPVLGSPCTIPARSTWSPVTKAWGRADSGAVKSDFTRFQSHLLGREPRCLTQLRASRELLAAHAAPPAGRAAIWPCSRTPASFTPWSSSQPLLWGPAGLGLRD